MSRILPLLELFPENNVKRPHLLQSSRRKHFIGPNKLELCDDPRYHIHILALIGAIPTWPYNSGWGYGPPGLVGTILIVILILVLLGKV